MVWSWLIWLGVFIIDTTVTFVRRAISANGSTKRIEPRVPARRGAERRARARHGRGRRHQHLLAVSDPFLVAVRMLDGVSGILVADAPLVAIAVWFRAGLTRSIPPESFCRNV